MLKKGFGPFLTLKVEQKDESKQNKLDTNPMHSARKISYSSTIKR